VEGISKRNKKARVTISPSILEGFFIGKHMREIGEKHLTLVVNNKASEVCHPTDLQPPKIFLVLDAVSQLESQQLPESHATVRCLPPPKVSLEKPPPEQNATIIQFPPFLSHTDYLDECEKLYKKIEALEKEKQEKLLQLEKERIDIFNKNHSHDAKLFSLAVKRSSYEAKKKSSFAPRDDLPPPA
jgi:hypothetical protein